MDETVRKFYPSSMTYFFASDMMSMAALQFMSNQPTRRRIWPAVLGVIVFAVLMGVRPEFSSIWVRAALAGCAGGALGWGIRATSLRRS
jgi:hypothetical protein